jgi:endothelin-converting enzyme/putative endopeptidase
MMDIILRNFNPARISMSIRRTLSGLAALSLSCAAAAGGPAYGAFGIDLDARATAVEPGDDFWTYTNGSWSQRTPIGASIDAAGVGIDMRARVDADVRTIVEGMAARPAQTLAGRQIGALYTSWMDEAAIEARGTAVLQPFLERIDQAGDVAQLQDLFASAGYASPLVVETDIDPNDAHKRILAIGQGTLGMPRDYYLKQGAEYDGVRQAYRHHVEQLLRLAGRADAGTRADAIVALETAMATAHWSAAASRDLARMTDIKPRARLDAAFPGFDWTRLLAPYATTADQDVVVHQNSAVVALGGLLTATPLQTWKAYLAYRFVADHADYLPRAIADASFDFHGKTLGGMRARPERWKRGVQLVNATLGDAVGHLYLERHYPPAARTQMQELVDNLRAAYRERIAAAAWMDAPTRRAALDKLAALKAVIGGPATAIDTSALRIERDDLLGNVVRAAAFDRERDAASLGRPVDSAAWVTLPQTMNAFYDQTANAIVFPAAILQPPYFDPRADAAVNYGTIAVLIGHEMGHAFDDQGRQFGADGRRTEWWTPAAAAAFRQRADALSAQYESYRPLPDVHIDGALTIGENIADLSGVEAAYAAYEKYQARHGKAKVLAGYSGAQRFFLAFAQGKRTKVTDAALRQLLSFDPHSPPMFRVNGTLRNVDAWYRAFDVKPDAALYLAPAQRVHLW